MKYIVILILNFIVLLLYFQVAKKYNIVDKPNQRTSHKGVVIRGGGILFVLAYLLSIYELEYLPYYFISGFIIMAIISFTDDIYTLSSRFRIPFQLFAVSLLVADLNIQTTIPYVIYPIIIVLIVAVINAYNFMDGINGINGMYSFVVLMSIGLVTSFESESILYLLIAIVVFGFFNFRTKALCFSGDVGSVSLAFIIIFMISTLIYSTGKTAYILFLLVYGLDSFWTVIQRLKNGENILEAHRKHLFQLYSNQLGYHHLLVSSFYSLVQIIVTLLVIINIKYSYIPDLIFTGIMIVIGSTFYIRIKLRLYNR